MQTKQTMLFNKLYFLASIVAVLVLMVTHTNGSTEAVENCVNKFEEGISNDEYRIRHKGAFDAMDIVNNGANQALQKIYKQNEKHAINVARESYLECIKCVAVAGDQAYLANQEIEESSDPESEIQEVNKGNTDAKKGAAVAIASVYYGLGAATEIAGNYSKQPLRQSMKYAAFAEQAAYSGLDEVQKLATLGLVSGGAAKNQSLKASNEAVEATGSACYFNLLKSAKLAFEIISKSRTIYMAEENSSGTEAAKKSPEATSAIEYINNIAESSASENSESLYLEAINLVKDGIIDAIKGVAVAIEKLQEVLKDSQKTKLLDFKSSEKLIKKAIIQSQNDIAYATTNAIQSLTIAARKVGGEMKFKLEEAILASGTGCSAAYESLQVAKFLSLKGLENGETSRQTGLTAANDAILTAAFAIYAQFITAANIAIDILSRS